MAEQEEFVPPLDDWIASNYDARVADKNSGVTYKSIADKADDQNDKVLASWARAKAAGKDADVTPTGASYDAPDKVTRIVSGGKADPKEAQFDITEPVVGAEPLDDEGHPVEKKTKK